ncbi:MAG TPA: hypothetical protein VNT26_11010 [Candidatus Sulfotelmatobacter sp.]|nr:hypothetical protein [Candidatus Sulfotelmatobacter sp.]
MQTTSKSASKLKIALMWLLLVGNIIFWTGLVLWRHTERAAVESPPDLARAIFMIVIGVFFAAAGVAGYMVAIFSDCLTFNFQRPVWKALKAKLYVANIIVPMLVALGLGLASSAFVSPVLTNLGLSAATANLLPVMVMVGLLQVIQLWVLVWAPLERRLITRRLLAQGITPAQLASAVLVGISDPASSLLKRFGAIEEDIGGLWVGQYQVVFWGDGERFAINRDQLLQIERKADARSTTMLSGIMHIILHVSLPDGSRRQIRLHTEGLWTMGQKRKVMNELGDLLLRWSGKSEATAAA